MTPEQQLTALARHVREEVQHQSEVKRRLMLGASIRCVCRMLRVDSSRMGPQQTERVQNCMRNGGSATLHTRAWRESAVPICVRYMVPGAATGWAARVGTYSMDCPSILPWARCAYLCGR